MSKYGKEILLSAPFCLVEEFLKNEGFGAVIRLTLDFIICMGGFEGMKFQTRHLFCKKI